MKWAWHFFEVKFASRDFYLDLELFIFDKKFNSISWPSPFKCSEHDSFGVKFTGRGFYVDLELFMFGKKFNSIYLVTQSLYMQWAWHFCSQIRRLLHYLLYAVNKCDTFACDIFLHHFLKCNKCRSFQTFLRWIFLVFGGRMPLFYLYMYFLWQKYIAYYW